MIRSDTIKRFKGALVELGGLLWTKKSSDPTVPTGTVATWYNSTTDLWKGQNEAGTVVSFADTGLLGSTANGKGASLVAIEDSAGLITAAQVEAALAEIVKKANAGLAAPMTFEVTNATLANADVVARFTPGFAGKIRKITAFVRTAASTANKAATLTPYIGGVTVTGGALALTTANCSTKGAKIDGSAITAANSFTSTDEITVVVSGVTTFVEGATVICLFFDPAA